MYIKEITADDHNKYNGLSTLYGSVFDSLRWTRMIDGDIKHFGIYDAGNDLIGGFIGYTASKFGISIYRNPPLTPSIGPFLKIKNANPVGIMEKKKQVLTSIAEFIDKKNYPVISVSLSRDIIDMQPFIWRDFKVIPEYTYILQLSLPVDEIWRRMSADRRNSITKATKDGLSVTNSDDYATVKSLVTKTYSRQKKAFGDSYTNKVLFEFANKSNSFAFIALQDSNPIACTFCVHDSKTAYYLLGGYDSERKHNGAGSLCIWESIKHAKSLGLTYFDFEGSMVPNIEKYLRGFGGELTPYYRINKAALPLEMILKFFKRGLF